MGLDLDKRDVVPCGEAIIALLIKEFTAAHWRLPGTDPEQVSAFEPISSSAENRRFNCELDTSHIPGQSRTWRSHSRLGHRFARCARG